MDKFVENIMIALEGVSAGCMNSSAISKEVATKCLEDGILTRNFLEDMYKGLKDDCEYNMGTDVYNKTLTEYKSKPKRFYNIVTGNSVSHSLLKELIEIVYENSVKEDLSVGDRLLNIELKKNFIDMVTEDIAFRNRVLEIVLNSTPSAMINNEDVEGSVIEYINVTK